MAESSAASRIGAEVIPAGIVGHQHDNIRLFCRSLSHCSAVAKSNWQRECCRYEKCFEHGASSQNVKIVSGSKCILSEYPCRENVRKMKRSRLLKMSGIM